MLLLLILFCSIVMPEENLGRQSHLLYITIQQIGHLIKGRFGFLFHYPVKVLLFQTNSFIGIGKTAVGGLGFKEGFWQASGFPRNCCLGPRRAGRWTDCSGKVFYLWSGIFGRIPW